MIVVTGGAGFIGSALVQELNRRGRTDLIVVDDVDHPEKEKNMASIKYQELRRKDVFLENVLNLDLKSVEAIIHMGACSSCTIGSAVVGELLSWIRAWRGWIYCTTYVLN